MTTTILSKQSFDRSDIITLLSSTDPAAIEQIRSAAEAVLLKECGSAIRMRGLIEFSNICSCDCFYCGIRASNRAVNRYQLSLDEIIQCARQCAEWGYGSIVLQSGQRRDEAFIGFIEECVNRIKDDTRSSDLPQGLGITLCVGEQSVNTYRRWFSAGAHRYLLRIETTSPSLFSRIHPSAQTLDSRISCLRNLKEIGYQVGTGVMIGLPGQTTEDLANDICFFRSMDIDMIGMGPYIPHHQTPMVDWPRVDSYDLSSAFRQSLLMIAVCRLALPTVNIAATTALQALQPDGREQGLRFGANVIMPQVTPERLRKNYQLYDGKPCSEESAGQCRECLMRRIASVGRTVEQHAWGDAPHAKQREIV